VTGAPQALLEAVWLAVEEMERRPEWAVLSISGRAKELSFWLSRVR
jgi:hypothetical protein